MIGKGIIQWDDFIKHFPKQYSGILSLEVYPENEGKNEDDFLMEAFSQIDNLENQLRYK